MNEGPLFTVEHAFQLADRGCVLAPGPSIEAGAVEVRAGDRIRLVLPAGSAIETQIRSLEMIKRATRPDVLTAPILLPREITKEMVPVGTQVYLID
jgi:hypothetical protein